MVERDSQDFDTQVDEAINSASLLKNALAKVKRSLLMEAHSEL
jgi:hypothetical protein